MARNSEYDSNSTTIGLGQVAPRPIIRRNVEAFTNALNRIDERSDRAIEKKSSIDAALSQINLNAKEDRWKYDYIKGLKDKIDKAAKYGDYSRALDTATELATYSVNSPELKGRIRANESYENKKKEVETRNDIDEITKKRWLAQNQYKYNDIYDDAGNIVGGTDWKANWNPVKKIDPVQLAALAAQFTSESSHKSTTGNSTQSSYSDEHGIVGKDGNITKGSEHTYSDNTKLNSLLQTASSSSSVTSSSGVSSKSYERIKNTFDALWKINPDAMLSLSQEYDDMQWQLGEYKRLIGETNSPVEKERLQQQLNSMNSVFLGRNGQLMTQEEWMYNKIDPLLKSQSYRNTDTSKITSTSSDNRYGLPNDTGGRNGKSNDDNGNGNGSNYLGKYSIIQGEGPVTQKGGTN